MIDRFFQLLDTNNDKIVSVSEFREIVYNFKLNISQKDINNIFNVLDKERIGQFDLE
jgi:Ca2+-binding EF-hand superfamily protein